MPIYEYRCRQCGQISEHIIGVGKGEEVISCRSCGGKEMIRLLSTTYVSKGDHPLGSRGGRTCCGREERCESPPCSSGGSCRR